MLQLRLAGLTYQQIANEAGISRQRIQVLLSPPPAIREYVVKKYAGKCAKCGILVGKSGHVHHKNHEDNHYNDIENLELLCPSCHREKHKKEYTLEKPIKEKLTSGYVCNCPKCKYQWTPRLENPKRCPQCQTRLPYQ